VTAAGTRFRVFLWTVQGPLVASNYTDFQQTYGAIQKSQFKFKQVLFSTQIARHNIASSEQHTVPRNDAPR
jgi:hypothetical protein